MMYELTQVEAAYRAVARCEGRVVCFHPTLAELPALCGMTTQGFNAGSAIRQASASLRLTRRQTPAIQTRLLETTRLKPYHIAQRVCIGPTVVALIRPERRPHALTNKALMCFDHRAYGGFVCHPE
jgi:hypothetical protein